MEITSSSGMASSNVFPRRFPKSLIRSSSKEIKKTDSPGSPCRPARPRNWLSIRRDSWRSVPMIFNPPTARTSSVILISVPRPAIFVAIVTALGWPAKETTSASRWCCFAFNTLWGIPARLRFLLNISEISTEIVPTNTGWPFLKQALISSTMALCLAWRLLYIWSSVSTLITGLFVGMVTTCKP